MSSQEGRELRSGIIYPFEKVFKTTGTGKSSPLSPLGALKCLFKTPKPPNVRPRNRQTFLAHNTPNKPQNSKYDPDLLGASPVLSRTHSAPELVDITNSLHEDYELAVTTSHNDLSQPRQRIKITTPFSSFGSLNSLNATGEISYPLTQTVDSSSEVDSQGEVENLAQFLPREPLAPEELHVNLLEHLQIENNNHFQLVQAHNYLDHDDPLNVLEIEAQGQPIINNMAAANHSASHRPPTFLGTGDEDANEFMRLFKLYCEIHGDPTEEPEGAAPNAQTVTTNAVRRFQLNISGDCARWFAELPARDRFPAIQAAFLEKYCNRADNWAENVQLRQIIQMPSQSVENYLKKFSDQARKIGKPLRTCITDIVEGFLPEIQREVLMMCPQTIDDVIKYAKLAEVVCNKLQLQGSKGTSESTQLAQVNHMVREREDFSRLKEDLVNAILEVKKANTDSDTKPKGGAQVNQYQNQQRGRNNNNNNPKSRQFGRFQGNCYNCGLQGHKMTECRRPRMPNNGGYNAGYNRGYNTNLGGNFRFNPMYQEQGPNPPPAISYNSGNRDNAPHNIQNPMDQLSEIVRQGTSILNALRQNSN
jgi:hypothetical protein